MILAIDTATQYAGLALYSQDGVYAEESWHTGRNHTVELMPRLARLFKSAGLTVPELEAVAVSLGPGSFTGLRIGLAAAKGLALPHQLPLIGIPTLDTAAYPLRDSDLPVWAIVQAGRGRILAARYGQVDGQWRNLLQPQLTSFKALAAQINEPAWCTGEIDQQGAQILQRGSRRTAQVVSVAMRLRRAGYLAELAAARLAAGERVDPDSLEPIYPAPL